MNKTQMLVKWEEVKSNNTHIMQILIMCVTLLKRPFQMGQAENDYD